jgi:VIT1/CCC1 family predicted Fe2+/Mn2+ transporter
MKCPKCRAENPDDEIFCQQCDWRLDQKYVPEKKTKKTRSPLNVTATAAFAGIFSLIVYYADFKYAPIALGAVGLFMGGYGITYARLVECNKNLCMALAAVGLLTGILGLMFGIKQAF